MLRIGILLLFGVWILIAVGQESDERWCANHQSASDLMFKEEIRAAYC